MRHCVWRCDGWVVETKTNRENEERSGGWFRDSGEWAALAVGGRPYEAATTQYLGLSATGKAKKRKHMGAALC